MPDELDALCINTIRFLSVDAVQNAKSGHPGMPLDAAPMAYALWTRRLKHNPRNPHWFDRDRFVLSAGHGSMLLYSLLYLTGYDVSLDDIRQFRQWDSKAPGHPERGHTPGVEVTTGPLGQGLANAVGMAIAEAQLAAQYNRPGFMRGRPRDVRDRQRRRPDGRRGRRSRVPRRPPAARQAHLPVRRQSRDACGGHRYHVLRRSSATIRRVRMAHGDGRRRQRHRRDRRRTAGGARRNEPAFADPRPHAHRLRLAEQAGLATNRTARRSASTKCA